MDRRERYSDADTALLAAFQGQQAGLWTAMPGIVSTALDMAKRTVSVQPALRARVEDKDGNFDWVQMPVLVDCPVVFPSGGGCTLTFPVKVGDECLVVFASRCIDAWWQSGGVQNQADLRMHDLSDGFVIVGASSVPKVISAISANNVQLRSDDGQAFVEIDPSSHKVRVKTSGQIELDATQAITIKSAAQINLQAPIIAIQGNMTWAGVGGGGGTVGVSNMNVTYTGGSFTYNGATITADGKNIGSTHTHSGVTVGGGNTGAPN